MGFERVCQRLLEYGVLAPSVYNTQPWKFLVDGQKGIIDVEADTERARTLEIDPKQRDLYLALGACVENMVLAAPALGYEIEFSLFPQDNTVARLKLKLMAEAAPENLFSSLMIRQTHAGKYRDNSVQELHLERLHNIPAFSTQENIYFLAKEKGQELVLFLHNLAHQGSSDLNLVEEGARWIRPESEAADGISINHIGLPISVTTRFALLRYFFSKKEIKEVARQTLLRQGHFIEAPGFLLMTTQKSDSESYLNAGRWYARLVLTLSEIELGAQVLHLPITMGSAHEGLRKIFETADGEEPVLLLRFGQPIEKKWPRTHRRPITQCLSFVSIA